MRTRFSRSSLLSFLSLLKQANGLANACLARDPSREDVKRRIYDLESHWYNGSNPKTYTEHQQRIADHKSKLTKLRDQTERNLDILDNTFDNIYIIDDSPNVWINTEKYITKINFIIPNEFRGNPNDNELIELIKAIS